MSGLNSIPNESEEFDLDQMRAYMKLSVEEKLKHIERLNQLTNDLMPDSSKKIWERLKEEGF